MAAEQRRQVMPNLEPGTELRLCSAVSRKKITEPDVLKPSSISEFGAHHFREDPRDTHGSTKLNRRGDALGIPCTA